MDEFNSDIFTFRHNTGVANIVDDVILKQRFNNDQLLDALTDSDVAEFVPILLGYQYLTFN